MGATTTTGFGPARALLGEARFRAWALTVSFARLPGAMAAFSLQLAGHAATGSFAKGAWMAAAYALGAAAAAPFRGRRMDGTRLPQGLRRGLHAQALLLCAVAVLAALRAPLPVLLGASLLLGVVPAGVPGGFRALLSRVVPRAHLEPAFALDAVLVEAQWVVGPLLVGLLAARGSPLMTLGVMAAAAAAAAALCLRMPAEADLAPAPAPVADGGARVAPGSVLRAPGVAGVLGMGATFGLSWGAVDAGLPSLLERLGPGAAAWGVLAALLSVASVAGGLAMTVAPKAPGVAAAQWRGRALMLLWGVLLLPTLWVSSFTGLALALMLAGLSLAPLTGTLTFLLQRALPPSQQAEGFSMYAAGFSLGMAAGHGLAGALLDGAGPRAVLAAAALVPVGAALLGALGALRRRPSPAA
jgi:MFS family permease